MKSTVIKLYGERNCGTNYLQRLIQRNLDVKLLPGVAPRRLRRLAPNHPALHERLVDGYFAMTFRRNLGWKHTLAPDIGALSRTRIPIERTLFIFLTKNPYAWLLSLFRHPYHYQGPITDFDAFIRSPWPTVGRENHPTPFPNPIVMWNRKNAAYLRLASDLPVRLILRYEDLVADAERTIRLIADTLASSLVAGAFVNIRASVKGEDGKDFAYYQSYYREARWRQELDESAIAIINRFLDASVMEALAYEALS